MSQARFIVGDALVELAKLPEASVDLVFTSPPFLALRSYLPADHPDKGAELGTEASPGAFIDGLLAFTEACRRVLAPHGTLCLELGDTYSGSGGAGGDYGEDGLRAAQTRGTAAKRYEGVNGRSGPGRTRADRDGWPLDKSLCLVPELYRVALVYGFNPLTGRTTPRWRARNVVRWCRPNPPVGALGDKVRPATSDIVVACVGRRRYFDLDAVRSPLTEPDRRFQGDPNPRHGWATSGQNEGFGQNPVGGPPLDHWWFDDVFDQDAWEVPTQPYRGSHYATFPEALVERPVKAMSPQRVCRICGQPSERIVKAQRTLDGEPADLPPLSRSERAGAEADGIGHWRKGTTYETLGWTDCGHDDWRNGMVLDPFAGSGTTLAVAVGHGRDAIGIDLDARNLELARQRVGLWLQEGTPAVDTAPL